MDGQHGITGVSDMFAKMKNQKGIALLIALMLMLMLSIIGLGIVMSSNDEVTIAGNEYNEMRSFYVAESGLDIASAAIQAYYEVYGEPPIVYPADTQLIDGITMGFSTIMETPTQHTLVKGAYAGLRSFSQPYGILSTAVDSSHATAVSLEQTFEVAMIPIFQFAVFYDEDLEIAPDAAMILNGRVHSNHDIYLQSDLKLQFGSYLTATGNINHGRKAGSGLTVSNGDIDILSTDGNYYSMRDGSDWLESSDPYWYDSTSVRWRGRVQDASFGQENLKLPIQSPTDSLHKIIEPAAGGNTDSYENKATFKIIDGRAEAYVGGMWIDVTPTLLASGVLKHATFFDKRENQDINVYDVDMSLLNASGYFPSNGIIYISDERASLRGTRITNASDIVRPLTIASENPVYTKGDINSINKVPMSIITDALTILSDNWSDDPAFAAASDKNLRQAQNTTINLCFITGNHETGGGGATYNGGLENLPRFLENWTGKTLTYRGSMVNLWYSQMATGFWSLDYFSPPNRNWAFDPDLNDLANMPPGTPMVRAFIRWGWKQIDVGYTPEMFSVNEEI